MSYRCEPAPRAAIEEERLVAHRAFPTETRLLRLYHYRRIAKIYLWGLRVNAVPRDARRAKIVATQRKERFSEERRHVQSADYDRERLLRSHARSLYRRYQ